MDGSASNWICEKMCTGRLGALAPGEEERQVDVAERDDEGEDRARHQARPEQRQGHLDERLEPAGPEAHRRLFQPRVHPDQAGRHAADDVGRRDDDVTDQQRQRRGGPREPRQVEVHGGAEQDVRHQQRRQKERLDRLAAAEPEPHEPDRRQRADERGDERRRAARPPGSRGRTSERTSRWRRTPGTSEATAPWAGSRRSRSSRTTRRSPPPAAPAAARRRRPRRARETAGGGRSSPRRLQARPARRWPTAPGRRAPASAPRGRCVRLAAPGQS